MPLFEFSEYDGSQQFRPLSADAVFDKISEHLLEYGDYVLRQLEKLDDRDAELLKMLIKEGYLEQDEEGKYAIAPRGIKRIENKAIEELFTVNRKDTLGKHPSDFKGAGQVRHDDSKPYQFGDPVANLNLHETLKNAFHRQASGGREPPDSPTGPTNQGAYAPRSPSERAKLNVAEEDFVVYETEFQTSCATVVLLDMSGSMARYGKFYHAKKVALALLGLVRSRYTEDTLKVIGFYTYASPLSERQLLHAAPKPVSIFDSRVFLRVNLDAPPEFVPEHFTNIQAGLKFARQHLQRQSAANKQIICITDGEPTAHLEGRDLVLLYPPSERTARATLQEVQACAAAGIQMSTFALIEDYFYLGLMNFVDQMARTGHGLAIYCNAGELGGSVLDSFVRGRRSRKNTWDEIDMSDTITLPEERTEEKTKRQPPYHVILLNDDDHSYQYVIFMLQKLFGHPPEAGFKMAEEVDKTGRVIVDTTSRERAELKQEQIHAFGPDPLTPRCQGSMSAVIEPAE